MTDPASSIPEVSGVLGHRPFSELSLPELLELRDRIIANRKGIEQQENGRELYKFAAGRVQAYIYKRRTERKSGLIIPYNKDITTD